MTSLKARLAALFALLFAAGFVALSSGAERAPAPPLVPFTDIGATLTGVGESTAAWGDYDADDDLDVVLAGYDGANLVTKIYRNSGGSFSDSGIALTGVASGAAAWGDYDSDGDLDLLLVGHDVTNPIAKIYRNDGAGVLTDIAAALTGVYVGSAAWGDYDADGDLDILLAGYDGANLVTKIYRNDGGVFTDIAAGLTGVAAGAAAWGDFDSDGDLDVALSGVSSTGPVSKIYRNSGGAFTDIGVSLTNIAESTVAWGDYNSDGRLDLVLAGLDGATAIAKIYRNDGDGAFTAIGAGLTGAFLGSAAWGDYDNDGDLDLVLTGNDGTNPTTTIYANDGGGAFTNIAAGLTGAYLGSAAWGDYDLNGTLDIALTGFSNPGFVAKIYRNEYLTANSAPETPTALLTTRDSAGRVTLSWNAATDSATPTAALSYNLRLSKGGSPIFSPMAATNGYRRVVRTGNLGGRKSIVLSNLADGTYTWSVQAIDSAYAGSAFASTKTFKLPPVFSAIKLSPSKIRRCGKPSSAVYKGQIAPVLTPAVKVTLQKRAGKYGSWKKLKVVKTNASGAFTFKKVGKTFKRSLWLRVASTLPGGVKIASKPKLLRVKACHRP